jgi:hypothetical protein
MSLTAEVGPTPRIGRAPVPAGRLACVAVLLTFHPAALAGQGVRGHLLDAESAAPITAATVSLVDARGQVARTAITDDAGAFSIPVPFTGRYHLRAERLGYAAVESVPFHLMAGDSMLVELRMGVEAVPLAPLEVKAAARRSVLDRNLDEFYERQRRGWGTYWTPADIERLGTVSVVNLLQMSRGVRIEYSRGRPLVRMRATGGRSCTPTVYLDGHRWPFADLESVVPAGAVRAMEVYGRAMEVPGEYSSVQGWNCGAVLIWTDLTIPR